MFKRSFIFATAMLGMLAFAPLTTWAQDDAEETTEAPAKKKAKKKEKKPASPVVTAVKKVKKVKGRLNDKADYYIFLFSASWCGPCCKEMPNIVETYKDIKKSGKVDVVLFCQDRSMPDAKTFVKNFDIKFLTVFGGDDKCAKVPGHAPSGSIPYSIVVDRYGRKITAGHPASIIPSWESHTIGKGEPEPPADKK